jgi:hypothetical protein
MIPVLLDLLTIYFLVASAILLWLNLRTWRRTGLQIAPENSDRGGDRKDSPAAPLLEAESLTWSTPFDDWIDLPDGRKLFTLRDAAAYVGTLPEVEQQATEWKSAARSLVEAAKHRDLLVPAHIDMLKALNRRV